MIDYSSTPHRRFNILTGEWVLVSPHRTKRPWQGSTSKPQQISQMTYDENCYLCPGNVRAGGIKNPDYSSTFSFVNDFGAIHQGVDDGEEQKGLLLAKSEKGICKVICFSPNHSLTLPLMSIEEIKKVIALWIEEYRELGALEFINHVQIFENKGSIMGCSNPHPHGQIWAQESIPEEVLKKGRNMLLYWNQKKKSILSDYIEQELKEGIRVVLENENFVVLVPFWAIWPYETILLPKRHVTNIRDLNADEIQDFAEILKELTIKYDNLFQVSFPYSAGIHQAPTDGLDHPEWHWHMSFYPPLLRSAEVKKFMVGYEMFANPQRDITAEAAAATLRQLSAVHYSMEHPANP